MATKKKKGNPFAKMKADSKTTTKGGKKGFVPFGKKK